MDETDALDWSHAAVGLRERRTFERRASAAECAAVSRAFGDVVCRMLQATYALEPVAPGRYRATGRVEAEVEQTCGVTLDPIVQQIAEAFDVEFRGDVRPQSALEPDFDALGADDPEPIEHGELRIGRFLCEIVASAIDPFPRGDDATLDRSEADGGGADESNPFSVLARLKGEGGAK